MMMGVARASLLTFLWIYSLSLLPQDCSSQRPTTGKTVFKGTPAVLTVCDAAGVLLFLESGRDSLSGSIVANNSYYRLVIYLLTTVLHATLLNNLLTRLESGCFQMEEE